MSLNFNSTIVSNSGIFEIATILLLKLAEIIPKQNVKKISDVFELITISCTIECTTISSNLEVQGHNEYEMLKTNSI